MTPQYSQKFITRIGEILSSDKSTSEERAAAIQTLNEWRTLYLHPLNTFQATLRKYVRVVDSKGIVAQRLKRTPTILDKLHRFPSMELGRMHDIGGLRAIVKNIQAVRELEKKYHRSRAKHVLRKKYDYIAEPKPSGYRGIHLVYQNSSPNDPACDGLLVEIQLRSHLQHLWATAVETVGFFYQEALKSSQGNTMWLEFFKLVSAVFAYEEKELPNAEYRHLALPELIDRVKQFDEKHGILQQLYLIQVPKMAEKEPFLLDAAYLVLVTSVVDKKIKIHSFLNSQQESASLVYQQLEQSEKCRSGESQVVLVSVDSVKKLEKAYPNFFLNIREFTEKIKQVIQS